MLIKEKIQNKLHKTLNPIYLEIIDESAMHHNSNNAETHFKIDIVSETFMNKRQLLRHRTVQEIIKDELSQIKAFTLHTYTASEWEENNKKFERSPSCRGRNESGV